MTNTASPVASQDPEQPKVCCPGLVSCKRLGFLGIVLLMCIAYVVMDSTGDSVSISEDRRATFPTTPGMQIPLEQGRNANLNREIQPTKTGLQEPENTEISQTQAVIRQVDNGAAEMQKAQQEDSDQKYRKLIVGTWEDGYQGKRVMQVRDDGTATMNVYLSGLKATLFAKHLKFDMKWSIHIGRLLKHTVGGEPKGKVDFILSTMGDSVSEPILELTEKRLRLLDVDGKTEYDWQRVNDEAR